MLQVFGNISTPQALQKLGDADSAFGILVSRFVQTLIVIAGIWALINLVLAGYAFMSAGDDPKKVAGAWAKIWQTMLGLAVAAGSFVLAAIFSRLIFGTDYNILIPSIPQL